MKRVGLLSDTHSWLDQNIPRYLAQCDEIWHAGDFGDPDIANRLEKSSHILRGVYGNIDGAAIRNMYPEQLIFSCEQVRVMMRHIGGYPGNYAPGVRETIRREKINLFISGHSHILKIIYDGKLHCMHMNSGAAGNHGWHLIKTMIRFEIDGSEIKNCEVVELGKRGALSSEAEKK